MANPKTNGSKPDPAKAKLVAEWYKHQKTVDEARETLEAAQAEASKFARALYEAFGSKEPITVNGRKYRAMHYPERAHHKNPELKMPERWGIMPMPNDAVSEDREFNV